MLRLDKYLADCGVGTRSEVKKYIKSGRVSVSGLDKISADTKLDESLSIVCFDNKKLEYKKFIYLMLNKPSGYVSAVWDKKLDTVIDLLPDEYRHFEPFPIGRLDIDTIGLLVLSNDGELSHKLLSPAYHIEKKYYAEVDAPISESDICEFENGMNLGDFVTKPARLEIVGEKEAYVTIAEGKFHQIKRMFEKVGKTVLFLKRVKMNGLELDENLELGEMRELSRDELELLKNGI